MIVCILGMHKSGTTLVAETLHHSGIHMAEVPDDLGYDQSNKYELHEAQAINRALIEPALIPTWSGYRVRRAGLDRAGYQINRDSVAVVRTKKLQRLIDSAEHREITQLVAAMSQRHSDWGFKDPRSCLTYDVWRAALPAHRLVAIHRPFDEVLLRYRVQLRSPVRLVRVARSWIVHNEMLLEHLRRSDDYVLLRYDELMSSSRELDRLSAYLERSLTDRRDPNLYRSRRTPGDPEGPAIWLPSPIARRAAWIQEQLDELRT